MNKIWRFFAFVLSLGFILSCNQSNQGSSVADAKIETLTDSMSYAVGVYLAQQIPPSDLKALNTMLIQQGIADFTKEEAKLDDQQVRLVINKYSQQAMAKAAEENKAKGEAFLSENKAKEGVETTASGLQYKVLTAGKGASPAETDKVKVHYTGRLLNGTVFDSSVQRGTPAEFPVNGVIAGWIEALQMMQPGAKWELYVPGNLAYGERGSPPNIGPNETLIFEVELLEILGK